MILTVAERLWPRVDQSGPNGCWAWLGYVDRFGYGRITFRGRDAKVHRVAYELLRGPIPDGLTIDHLCRNRACVNPAHLEPVTWRENLRRAGRIGSETHCLNGHEYTTTNTRLRQLANGKTSRRCHECQLGWDRQKQRKAVACA